MAVNLPNQFIGTAPQASYLLYVTEDVTSETPLEEALWVEAAELADAAGADIINTSLGYNTYDNAAYNHTYADMNGQTTFITKGSNMAFNKGIFCVTAAGNAGNSPWIYITAPADAINTLTVGAINANLEQVGFSSNGPTADNRIKPDLMALGQQSAVLNVGGIISTASGTSFSSPITAGLVASLWQALPQLKNHELLQLIKENSSFFLSPNNQYGYGIPCFYCAYQNALNITTSETSTFEIYPNPFENLLNINLKNEIAAPYNFQLKNTLGQTVFETKIYAHQNRMSFNLASGLYFYEIVGLKEKFTGKIIRK
jgi:subtilisin family serine protease